MLTTTPRGLRLCLAGCAATPLRFARRHEEHWDGLKPALELILMYMKNAAFSIRPLPGCAAPAIRVVRPSRHVTLCQSDLPK
jgi:hypothetical protein